MNLYALRTGYFLIWINIFSFAVAPLIFATPPLTRKGLSLFNTKPRYGPDFQHVDYTSPQAQKGGSISLSVPGTFDSLNPFIIMGVAAPSNDWVYATLLKTADDMIPTGYPYVAQAYALDPTVPSITFYLRPEATFSDGSLITAHDISFSFEVLTRQGSPLFKTLFKDVQSISIVNDSTITFVLSPESSHELPLIIGTHLPILSQAYYKDHDFSSPSLDIPVTSGPYYYKSVFPARSVTLARIKNWWGENIPITRYMYNFDEITFHYFRDPAVAFESFKKGDIDFRHEISASTWAIGYSFPAFLKGHVKRRTIPHQAPTGMLGFIFNTRRPPFNDIRVREALSILFDFEWINKNLFYNHYDRLKSFFSHTSFAAQGLPSPKEQKILAPFKSSLSERLFTEPFSPSPRLPQEQSPRARAKKALALLKEAGFTLRERQLINASTKKPFRLEILSNSPSMEKISFSYIKSLRSIGIDASFRYIDSAPYLDRTNRFDFDIVAGGIVAPTSYPGIEQEDYFGSSARNHEGSKNLAGVSNPVIDTLISKILKAKTLEELIPLAQALDRVLLWNFYVIPKWGTRAFHVAYWDKFHYPQVSPRHTVGFETWWVKKPKM